MKKQPRKHLEMKKEETKKYYPTKSTKSQEEKIYDIWSRTHSLPALSHSNRGESAVRQVQAGIQRSLCPWIPVKGYRVPLTVVAANITYPLQLHAEEALFKARVAAMSDELYPALIHRVNTLPLACQARSITAAPVSPKTDNTQKTIGYWPYPETCSSSSIFLPVQPVPAPGGQLLPYTTVLFILLRYCPIRF